MKKLITFILIIFILGILSFLIFKKSQTTNNSSKLQITASFYPMYFLTNEIGGNKVNVVNITPAGAEPHDYELTPQDIIQIEQSKLLVLNGAVEPWADKIKENLKGKNTNILVAGENLTTQQIKEAGVLSTDPHIWLSLRLAKIEAQRIEKALEKIDPLNTDYYKTNELTSEKKLTELDKNYKTGLASCSTRSFVTSHAAFGYLATDYNLNQISIDGLSPDEEPSLAKLAEISNFAKANNIKYIFFETLVSPKLSQTIASEVGAQTLVLDPIEGISNDDLSKGINYLTLMANNLENLRKALQCK